MSDDDQEALRERIAKLETRLHELEDQKILCVDREQFVAWCEGYFIKRDAEQCVIVNEVACERAVSAMARGETVALTVNGRIVSYMVETKDGYQEELSP